MMLRFLLAKNSSNTSYRLHCCNLLTAVIVTVVGPIGFIGLVAPHLMRLIGYRQHFTLLLSSSYGAQYYYLEQMLLVDLIDPTGAELPVGAVTAMIGSPWLIYLVYRMMKSKQYMNDNGANAAGASSRYYSYKR